MDRMNEITLGDVARAIARYRPFIGVVLGVLLIAVFLPGERPAGSGDTAADIASGQGTATGFAGQGTNGSTGTTSGTTGTGGTNVSASGQGSTSGGGNGQAGGNNGGGGNEDAEGRRQAAGAGGQLNASCDPNTGHLAIPELDAPPCVGVAPNTGDDYKGVTGDKIKVVYYLNQEDAASSAILTAAGADDSDEAETAQAHDWVEYYSHHFETYGREIELIPVKGSGAQDDDARAKADAIKVAEDIGAFASLNAPNATYVEELAARGVMCFTCQVSQPAENYIESAPYSWGTLMSSTGGYIHRAEYVGKRLAGKKAQHAGDPLIQQSERTFGLLYYNNNGAYKSGADFFETELDKYGVKLAARADYEGYPKTAESQEAARPLIQKMIDAGVTSILCACDPFAPVFFTKEATRQNYFPEWIITGSALTDTTLFARTYDQQQWPNAFGISFLTARMPEELGSNLRVLKWHFGQDYEPPANAYGVIRSPIDLFFHGVHMAGPTLTPETFKQGMFSMPPIGTGHIIEAGESFGPQVWPFDDYTALDDITMIWWDPNATGEDDIGNPGVGMYRYVDMGKRYLPGQQPTAPPKAFDTANTVTVYEDYPEGDRPPEYPHE